MQSERARESSGSPKDKQSAKSIESPKQKALRFLADLVAPDPARAPALKSQLRSSLFQLAHTLGHVPAQNEIAKANRQHPRTSPSVEQILAAFGSLPEAYRAANLPVTPGARLALPQLDQGLRTKVSSTQETAHLDTLARKRPAYLSSDDVCKLGEEGRVRPVLGPFITKYFDLIDEFIRVATNEKRELTNSIASYNLEGKHAYRSLVVRLATCFDTVILPAVKRMDPDYDMDIVEELVYQLVVDANPSLEIHQVTLPSGRTATTPGSAPAQQFETIAEALRPALPTLERDLKARVLGQDHAIDEIVPVLRRAAVDMPRGGPQGGVILLCGATGTGKTETVKALAKTILGTDERDGPLLRIDCAEYAQSHEYAKLIGSPPGYIGHNEGGILTDQAKKHPVGILLFDEIEKAHYKVHNLLLGLLDDGIVTDSKGSTLSFRNYMVFMTSNLGAENADAFRNRVGFGSTHVIGSGQQKDIYDQALAQFFRPEFIGRLGNKIVFHEMDAHLCARIVSKQLRDLRSFLATKGQNLSWDRNVVEFLTTRAFSKTERNYGAREVKKVIENMMMTPITDLILERGLDAPGWHFHCEVTELGSGLHFTILKEATA